MKKHITLAMGNGGEENQDLIKKYFFKYFKNDILQKAEDAAILDLKKSALSTDSFTVSPIFFNGGDIGKLAICGSCNDVAMMGAKPKYLSVSFIIEEGFSLKDLEKILRSMQKELKINEAKIVCGDTKVMPKGTIDQIIINTTAIGKVIKENISAYNLSKDDVILVSQDIGRHGATIFLQREDINLDSSLESDCQSLYPIVKKLIEKNIKLISLRDATRGGIAAVLNEWARASNVCIQLEESSIPISDEVRGVCEILGFEPSFLANEGTFLLATKPNHAQFALEVLKEFNQNAAIIGKVTDEYPKKVVLVSSYGTKRFLDMPTGELLPRIC